MAILPGRSCSIILFSIDPEVDCSFCYNEMSGERRSSDISWNDGGSLEQAGNCEAIADGVTDEHRMAGARWWGLDWGLGQGWSLSGTDGTVIQVSRA